jgi:GntR family transcriptional regulator/MocR family aminotransferase
MRTPIVVNRRSDVPLHRQIYDEWRKGILAGRFGRGDRMPSTRELAATLRVSRTTATAAYEQLIAEGYLRTARGSGTFVSPDLPDEPLGPARPAETAGGARAVRLSQYGSRLEPALSRVLSTAGVINLSKHRLEFEQFPIRLWRRLILRHLRHVTPAVFEYAESPLTLVARTRK